MTEAGNREGSKSPKKLDTRQWVYGGLLLFAVVGGMALAVVPALHNRLLNRLDMLGAALTGKPAAPITTMGEAAAYPPEFQLPASATPAPTVAPRVAASDGEPVVRRRLKVTGAPPEAPGRTGQDITAGLPDNGENGAEEAAPRFQQGTSERQAYEKVLAANPVLAGMTRGERPELRFKTWGAALREGNVYWVRVIFQNEDGADVQYLWQTDLTSGQTTPLSYNARTLS